MSTSTNTNSLPSSVDLSSRFDQLGLVTRPQGSRGTCSVFTVVGALEYALAVQRGQGTHLSVEFLNWAGHKIANRTVDGGFFSELWDGYVEYGICLDADLPYQEAFDSELQPSAEMFENARHAKDVKLQLHWIKEWDVTTGLTDQHVNEIKHALARQVPVCGGFRWPKKTEWVDSVLQMCPASEVFDGHSVLLEGYRDDPALAGGGAFVIRNSGGSSRQGFLPYEYVRAYMNDAATIEPTS